jgi:hypothetical protein
MRCSSAKSRHRRRARGPRRPVGSAQYHRARPLAAGQPPPRSMRTSATSTRSPPAPPPRAARLPARTAARRSPTVGSATWDVAPQWRSNDWSSQAPQAPEMVGSAAASLRPPRAARSAPPLHRRLDPGRLGHPPTIAAQPENRTSLGPHPRTLGGNILVASAWLMSGGLDSRDLPYTSGASGTVR